MGQVYLPARILGIFTWSLKTAYSKWRSSKGAPNWDSILSDRSTAKRLCSRSHLTFWSFDSLLNTWILFSSYFQCPSDTVPMIRDLLLLAVIGLVFYIGLHHDDPQWRSKGFRVGVRVRGAGTHWTDMTGHGSLSPPRAIWKTRSSRAIYGILEYLNSNRHDKWQRFHVPSGVMPILYPH